MNGAGTARCRLDRFGKAGGARLPWERIGVVRTGEAGAAWTCLARTGWERCGMVMRDRRRLDRIGSDGCGKAGADWIGRIGIGVVRNGQEWHGRWRKDW